MKRCLNFLLLLGLGLALGWPVAGRAAAYGPVLTVPAAGRMEATGPRSDAATLIAEGKTDYFHPAVAAGGMVVWYARGTTGDMDVFGLLLNKDGSSPGQPWAIASGAGDQAMPFVAADAQHGGYLVVWHDQGGPDANIHGRYLDAQGQPQGPPLAISTAKGDQLRPNAAYVAKADAFLVVWQDGRAGATPDVYARLVPSYSTGGAAPAMGKEFAVSTAPGGQFIPTAACETALAQCLVVWQDDRYSSRLFTDIVGRVVDAAGGTTVSKEIAVAVLPDYQYSPVVAFNPVTKEYLVVWDDDISAHRVSRAGEPQGSRVRVSLESPHQYKPAVAVAADGTYLVVWEDLRNLSRRGADVYGQWLSAAGLPLGINFALSSDPHNQYSPAVVAGQGWGPSDFFVIWEDDRTSGALLALYGQWLSRGAAGN